MSPDSSAFALQHPSRPPKVVVLGDTNVGKTLLCHRLIDPVTENYDWVHDAKSLPATTVGFDFFALQLTGHQQSIQLWDTAGQERFRAIPRITLSGTSIAVIVYDITQRSSFASVPRHADMVRAISPHAALIVVGNKADLVHLRCVTEQEGRAVSKALGAAAFLELSALTASHIRDVIDELGNLSVAATANSVVEDRHRPPVALSTTGRVMRRFRCAVL